MNLFDCYPYIDTKNAGWAGFMKKLGQEFGIPRNNIVKAFILFYHVYPWCLVVFIAWWGEITEKYIESDQSNIKVKIYEKPTTL